MGSTINSLKIKEPDEEEVNKNKSTASQKYVELSTAYPDNSLIRTISFFYITVAACLLPIVAIVVLAQVYTMPMILGLVALFTATCAMGMVLFTSKTKVKIFTATAA
jgi:hypothetical protein